MNRTKQYLNNLVNKIITETLKDKADEVMEKIKSSEFDYVEEEETCEQCGSKDEVMEKLHGKQHKLDKNKNGKIDKNDFKMLRGEMSEGETCEQCGGGEFYEGECVECGMKKGEMLEFGTGRADFTAGMDEDYLTEKWKGNVKVEKTGEHAGKSISEIDKEIKALKTKSEKYQKEGKKVPSSIKEKMSELYFAKRAKKDWPGKGKVDVDEEVEEGNAFSGAREKAIEAGKKSFKVDGKTYPVKGDLDETLYRLVDGEESALFTENEIIDIIENIVKEEKDNIKKGVQHKGLSTYEKAHKGSGKENKEYLDSVAKKLTEYIKDGSKGKYETNPKHFPKGNGQLEKMQAKKYTMSDDGKDFLDDFMRPGMENLDYDQIQPDEDWMKKNIEGSSETGNNPEWANAEETDLGEKINKKRKENKYAKAKRTAYRKSKQPVTDGTGENSGSGVDIKLESVDKKTEKLNEEFQRIQQLMGYTQKTQ